MKVNSNTNIEDEILKKFNLLSREEQLKIIALASTLPRSEPKENASDRQKVPALHQ